jgi:nucleoid DNA-binding protein
MTDKKQVLTKSDIIASICKTGSTRKDAEDMYNSMIESIQEALNAGKQVNFPGFGILSVTTRAARMGRNPSTGEQISISESRSVRFKMSSLLKKLLNS